ncbi:MULTISPECIES: cold-shock protein [Salegentibacter]|uniref:Cold shock domain-containing protein n=1 Tax=Salegentibacter maritimus TaxID=2794347 RepID=A0ABS0TJP7_9FLAO|nr:MULTISPECIES: cold shock domain-containing protein [Salegentibacter]MBE7638760.1 cold shock domain-containing protein [Salegentibacter sp. BLCTC]MBI6117745.1 cold shock domain-containing protein [Salegentibacter maritimus]MBI6121294.1 cold shock domain-containing protein [Salegentibacter maritimus]
MGKSQQTFSKTEKEKKKIKKRKEKELRKQERKENSNKGGSFEDMIAYVDADGNLTDTPPDPSQKVEVEAESIEIGIPKKEDLPEEDPVRNGKVSFFDHSKGFGFIIDSENNEKYFVHVTGLIDEINENDKVSFELEKGMKGMNAVRVKQQ